MEKSSEQAQQSTIIDEEKAAAARLLRKRYFLRCCSCAGAVLFFVVILAVTVIFTVFRVRGPVISLNNSTVKLELIDGTSLPWPGSNATINADVSIKNKNFVSFKHPITTSTVYYRGAAIGEVRTPAGNFPARRTKRINVTMNIVMDRVMEQPDFGSDVESGLVPMSWYTGVGGRAKFLIIQKHMTLKMDCAATVKVMNQTMGLEHYKCKPYFKL